MPVRRLLIRNIKELKFNIEKTKRKFKDMKLFDLRIRDMFGGLGSPPSGASSSKDHPLQGEEMLEDDDLLGLLQEVIDDEAFFDDGGLIIDKINNLNPEEFDSVMDLLKDTDAKEKIYIDVEEKRREKNKKRFSGLFNTELPDQASEDIFLKLFRTSPPESASLNTERSIESLHSEYERLLRKDYQDVKKLNNQQKEKYLFTTHKLYKQVSLFSIKARALADTINSALLKILIVGNTYGAESTPSKGKATEKQREMFLHVKDAAEKITKYLQRDESQKDKTKQELLNFNYTLSPINSLDVLPAEAISIVKEFDKNMESTNRALVPRNRLFTLPGVIFNLLIPQLPSDQFIPYLVYNEHKEKYDEIERIKGQRKWADVKITAEHAKSFAQFDEDFSPESLAEYRQIFTQSLGFLKQKVFWIQQSVENIARTHPEATNRSIYKSFIDNGASYAEAMEYIRAGDFMAFVLNKYQEGVEALAYVASNELKYRFYFLFLRGSISDLPLQYLLMAMLNLFFYTIHTAYKKIFPLIPKMSNGTPDVYNFLVNRLGPNIFQGNVLTTRRYDFKDFDMSLEHIYEKVKRKTDVYYEKNAMRMGDEFAGTADSVGLDEKESKDYEENSKIKKDTRGFDKRPRGKHKSINSKADEFDAAQNNANETRAAILESANKAEQELANLLLDSDGEVEANPFGDIDFDSQGVEEDIKTLAKLLSDNKRGKEAKKINETLKQSEKKLRAKLKIQIDKLKEDEDELYRYRDSILSKIYGEETAIKYKAEIQARKRKFAFDYERKLKEYKNTLRTKALAALKLKQAKAASGKDKTAFEEVSKRLEDSEALMSDIEKEIQSKKKSKGKQVPRKEILKKYDTFYKLQDKVATHVVKVQSLSKPNSKLTMNDLRKRIHNINELYVMPKVEKTQAQKDLEEAQKAQKEAQKAQKEKERKDKNAKAAKDRKDAKTAEKAARDAAKAAQALAPSRVYSSGRMTRSRAAQQGRGVVKGLLKVNVWMINKKLKR